LDNIIEERDALIIESKEKEQNQVEYIDELQLEGEIKPENEIQLIDQMEILKQGKSEFIATPEKGESLIISGLERPVNIVQERDGIEISGKEKGENQVEYIDELSLKEEAKPENEIQLIDQMEILKEIKPVKINKIDKKEKFTIKGKLKSPLSIEYKVSERDALEIPSIEKLPSQVEYIDEITIKGEEKPENEIQLIDQMEILKQEKPEIEMRLAQPSKKPLLKPQERDAIFILPEEKSPLLTEYIDEIKIKSEDKPDNEIQIVDQMEVPKSYEKVEKIEISKKVFNDLPKENIDSFNLLSKTEKAIKKCKVLEKPELIKEYIDELEMKGIEIPMNEIQIVDQMIVPKSYERKEKQDNIIEKIDELEIKGEIKEIIEIEKISLIKPKAPLSISKSDFILGQKDKKIKKDDIDIKIEIREPYKIEYIDEVNIQGYHRSPNMVQNIDRMEILPIPQKKLIIQNIDRLDIPRDYERYQYIMQSSWEEGHDVQASGRPIHVYDKETGLERQDIDKFEILGSIIPQNLELEYINSIEIIERNNNNNNENINNWAHLDIEYNEDLIISPDNNEIIGSGLYINRSINRGNNNINNNQGNQGNYQGGRSNLGNNIITNRYNEEDNNINISTNNSQNIHIRRDQYIDNYNNNENNRSNMYINNSMRGIVIRTIERENVEHFEIIGNEIGKEYETQRRIPNLQIQRINSINMNGNINNDVIIRGINENNNVNINLQNDNINNEQNIRNQRIIQENEMNNEEINININRSSIENERNIISNIRNRYNIEEIEKERQKYSWNKVNNIQQTSKLFIHQKRNSYSYFRESGNRNSWNETNRQQGIVNLSVIDDNKKNIEKNEENIINENDIGINFNDRNLQSSSRPNRSGNNDYDSDELGINNIDINKYGKKSENKEEFIEAQKEDQKEDKKEDHRKKSGNEMEKKKIVKKISPKEKQITYQYNSNQDSLHSSKGSYKKININNQQSYKQQSSSNKLSGKGALQGDKNKIKIGTSNININQIGQPSSINKKSQSKPSGLTYIIDSKNIKKEDNINLDKESKSKYSVNFPKTKTYERDSNPKYMSQSQIIPTGKMKKKSKLKNFEYLREPNQSQNFQ